MARKKINRRVYANKWQADRAKRENDNELHRATRKTVTFNLHQEKDADILDFLANLQNKVDFFREIIRREIKELEKKQE